MISFKTVYYEDIEPSIQDKIKNATSFEQALDLICSDHKLFGNFIGEFGFEFFRDYLHILENNERIITKYSYHSVEYARLLIQNNKPVPEIIERGIAEDSDESLFYARFLIQNNKPVPEIIQQSAENLTK